MSAVDFAAAAELLAAYRTGKTLPPLTSTTCSPTCSAAPTRRSRPARSCSREPSRRSRSSSHSRCEVRDSASPTS